MYLDNLYNIVQSKSVIGPWTPISNKLETTITDFHRYFKVPYTKYEQIRVDLITFFLVCLFVLFYFFLNFWLMLASMSRNV